MTGLRRSIATLALAGAIVTSGFAQQMGAPRDVPPGHWAHAAVQTLFREGILKGYPDGSFRGGRPVVRHELMALHTLNLVFSALPAVPEVQAGALQNLREQVAVARAQAQELRATLEEIPELERRLLGLLERLRDLRRQIDDIKGGTP